MVRGTPHFIQYTERDAHRNNDSIKLQADLRRIYNQAGNSEPPPTADVIKHLNTRKDRPWSNWNNGKGLSENDLVELTKQALPEVVGVSAIMSNTHVRTYFPKFAGYAKRRDM